METNNNEPDRNYRPRWILGGLGILLMIFVLLLIVQKANDLKNTFKNTKPANTMSVSADGKVAATPDLATMTVGVISQGTSAKDVKDQNNQKINTIIDFVKQQGVNSKDIQTSQFYSYPQQKYDNGKTTIVGYEANQTVTIKVHNIDKDQKKLEAILDGVVNNGANQVQGVNLSFEDPDNLKQEARKLAIAKAKEKAQELAREAGITLGKVVSVSENSGYSGGPIPYATDAQSSFGGAGAMKSIAPNVEPGSKDITATMTVVFEVK